MRKLLATFLVMALAFGGLPLIAASTPAHASWDWCWDDPAILLPNGHVVNIMIGTAGTPPPADQVSVDVVIHAPKGTVVTAPLIQSQWAEHVVLVTNLKAGDNTVSATVRVKSKISLSVEVDLVVDGAVDGNNHLIAGTILDSANRGTNQKLAVSAVVNP
jgi:hypothetical protein